MVVASLTVTDEGIAWAGEHDPGEFPPRPAAPLCILA
jgi:hypothetical protein